MQGNIPELNPPLTGDSQVQRSWRDLSHPVKLFMVLKEVGVLAAQH